MEDEKYLFDDYFEKINLNEELVDFYKFINDDGLTEEFINEKQLMELRNNNFNRYSSINLINIENLPIEYNSIVLQIKNMYSFIKSSEILIDTYEEAIETKKIIDILENYLNQLKEIVEKELNLLEIQNNDRQQKLKNIDYSFVDEKILANFLEKYNDLILFNSTIEDNIYDNYKRQIKRKKYINDLYRLINLEMEVSEKKHKDTELLSDMNKKIEFKIKEINEAIIYLEDLMLKNSKYKNEFDLFKNYFNSLIAYNDVDYKDVCRIYDILINNFKIKSLINYFEESFIKEIEYCRDEEKFIYDKYGIKNIKTSLDYISANYINMLTEEEKMLIEYLHEKVMSQDYNLEEIYNRIKLLTNNIWKKSITKVGSYNSEEDFNFICTNNQFIDEKHQAILITKKMLDRVTDYSDYQIGFICDYNDNLLYVTENEDIMTVDYNDMSNLKTPKQIEQEFLNFKVCSRLALNGYITKIAAVYYIDDGNNIKYKKAVDLSNQHKLPLIVLKKINK